MLHSGSASNMTNIMDLPPAILEGVFDYLQGSSLQSASLTTRTWSQVYKQHTCRVLSLDLSADTAHAKVALLERWENLGLLPYVHRITIDDSGERGRDGQELLEDLFDRWLPKLNGLKSVAWDLSGKIELADAFRLNTLPSGVLLDLVCEGEISVQVTASVLSLVQDCSNLRSLALEFGEENEETLGWPLKAALLRCKSLTTLKINVTSSHEVSHLVTSHDTDHTRALQWTIDEAASLPPLQHLDLHYPSRTGGMFGLWAGNGNWRSLETLKAHHGWILEHLAGRLPVLYSLSVNTVDSLPRFLELQPGVKELAVKDLDTSNCSNDLASKLHHILSLPFASSLRKLDLQIAHGDAIVEQSIVDVGTIATSCPTLQDLTVAVTSQQYRTAVGYFCWMDACIEAVIQMPNLLRLCIILPRVIPSGSISIQPEIIVLADAANLWSQLSSYGKKLKDVRIIASMANEKAESEREAAILRFLSPRPLSLTFVAMQAEKDWDADQGAYRTSCPELEQAEKSILRGQLSGLSETGEYSAARRTVDDISTFVHKGTIAPKKKLRPMPVWLTPEEEQDRREGPPSQSRRAKRAVIRSVSDFVGVWRLPMTETSPRTAEERARSREQGFGGRAGWSKSSLAMRVFYRR
jgi:hypothetical protein